MPREKTLADVVDAIDDLHATLGEMRDRLNDLTRNAGDGASTSPEPDPADTQDRRSWKL